MGDVEIPTWLKGLPLAPEYRPTETEFADPIAYISRIEKEASAFGICKVVPPLPKPSKKFVLSNLSKSLSKCPELGLEAPACSSSQMGLWDKGNGDELRAVFTTRHQELGQGVKRLRGPVPIQMQVWQSGEMYTLDQFESKSKAFARNHLSGIKDVSPLVIESLFWKAASEKPIYVEYANDVPGSGFGEPEEPFQHFYRRKRRRKVNQKLQERTACDEPNTVSSMDDSPNQSVSLPNSSNLSCEDLPSMSRQKSFNSSSNDREGTAGWKISNSPWNLQVIARSRGSLTRFMPDDIPGVTSPMVYIGMLFSWFAWHVEDHELHSLNFLHMGAPKTWYAIPGEYAFALEEVIRMKGYGGHLDRLAALTLLGEKTSLLSPKVVIESGIPCCRLVQNPGEFVVTFPRAYHIGFSHGFNCGEAANFATPQWLKVAKEAAIRRAAMNFLPMLSHQQLLYILTMSFVSRVPRALLPGVRSSRSKDRKKEERELLVKKAFIDDVVNENYLLRALLGKDFTFHAVLWDPELLPSSNNGSSSAFPRVSHEASGIYVGESNTREGSNVGHASEVTTALEISQGNTHFEKPNIRINKVDGQLMYIEATDYLCEDDDDLPCGLHVDSGTLACVACGVLGFPFMSVVQPSNRASEEIFPEELRSMNPSSQSCADNILKNSDSDLIKETCINGRPFEDQSGNSSARCMEHTPVATEFPTDGSSLNNSGLESSSSTTGVSSSTVSNKEQKREDLQHVQIGSSSAPIVGIDNPETMENIDKSNSIHPSTESGESGGSAHMEIDAVVKEDFRSTNALLTDFCKETKRSSIRTDVDSGEVNRQWNISNSFLRPRIFCLEHALEIQELLQSKGGANVLIICHSDYPKIKGEAMSIAEEIGVHFNCNNVPLEGASQLDLDLIYISIDDEHVECKEDWTAKLGLNLGHLVKLRKDCPSKQERPALALGGLFSDQVPASDVSSLRWHSRKSRTHHKPGGLSRSKQHGILDLKKDNMTRRNSDAKAVQENHGDIHLRGPDNEGGPLPQACRSHGCSYARKHHPPEWLASSSTIATKAEQTPDSENNGSVSGKESPIYEKLRNVNIEIKGLVGLNDSTSKNSQVQGERCIRQEDNSTLEGCNSVVLVDVSVLEELSGNSREFSTPVQTSLGGEVCDSAISGPPNIVIGTVVGSEALHQGILTMMDSSMASGRKDSLTYVCLSPSVDVPRLGNSQMHQEIQATIETTMANNDCSHLKFRDQPIEASETDKMIQTPEENNTASTVCDSAKLYSQHSLSVAVGNSDKIQQEVIVTTEETNLVDTATLAGPRTKFENPVKGEINQRTTVSGGDPIEFLDQSTIAIPCSNMQEVHTTDVCAPARFTDIPDIDLSRAESYEMQLGILPTKIATMHSSYDSTKLGLYSVSTAAAGNSEILQGHQTNVEMRPASELCSLKAGTEQRNAYPILVYSRTGKKQNKRKIEPEKKSYSQDAHGSGFIRSPCEGLRPRTGRKMDGGMIMSYRAPEIKKTTKKARNAGEHKKSYTCDLDGCRMSFSMKAELLLHKRNRCTHEGCRKRFSSHRYAMHHERVHSEERPLKCSWKGCGMSFKWAWARTEHMRLHTGERPYRCNVVGCGLTFRFVSDFSRHRRKTGHSVN